MRGYVGKKPTEVKEAVIKLFDKVIDAKTVEYYNMKMDKLKQVCGKRVIEMLDNIEPSHYVDCFFPGKRYGETTSNAAESLNKKFKDERELPILGLIDGIRLHLMKEMSSKRDASAKWKSNICSDIDKVLTARLTVGKTWAVVKASDYVYEVKAKRSVMVYLRLHRCICSSWQVDLLPCAHALSAILKSKGRLSTFIDPYYLTPSFQKTYELNIFPIPTLELPRSNRLTCQVWPPKAKAQPGRRKKVRKPSFGEFKRQMKCSICKQFGHNRKGCKQVGETRNTRIGNNG